MSRRIRSRKAGSAHYLAHENKFGKLLFVEFLHRKNEIDFESDYFSAWVDGVCARLCVNQERVEQHDFERQSLWQSGPL